MPKYKSTKAGTGRVKPKSKPVPKTDPTDSLSVSKAKGVQKKGTPLMMTKTVKRRK